MRETSPSPLRPLQILYELVGQSDNDKDITSQLAHSKWSPKQTLTCVFSVLYQSYLIVSYYAL